MPSPKPLVVLGDSFFPEVIQAELAPWAETRVAKTQQQLHQALKQAWGAIPMLSQKFDAKTLAASPRLKAIANYAVGLDNIDLAACAARSIRVTHTRDVLTRATAELTLTLLMAAARRVPEGEKICRSGRFKGWGAQMLLGQELQGRRAVIAGQGRIGQEVGKLFEALGIRVSWIHRQTQPAEIDALLREAQILSLHFPGTPQNKHWLSARRIALLPKDAIVINTARGMAIDEKALAQALKKRKIFAAGLDVYEHEPKITPALLKLPNVVMLPHVGSATEKTRREMVRVAARSLKDIWDGQAPWNEVKLPQ